MEPALQAGGHRFESRSAHIHEPSPTGGGFFIESRASSLSD